MRAAGGTLSDDTAEVGSPPNLLDTFGLEPGQLVGRYHVLERIGAGGMGVVYAAFDPDLDRKIALKVLQPERLDGDAGSRGHARLIREAKAMAKLAHPNVVTVHDVGVFDDRVFVAMEFVVGQTLTKWLEQRPSWDGVVRCFIEAGRGLAAAHAEGLVHRDFKPDNVLLGKDGRPRVLDFGLARSTTAESTEPIDVELEEISLERRMRSHDFADRITRTGGLTGTPAYMAPEQYLSKPLDARTDQFAFCVALWEGLHGTRPFQGDSTAALGLAVCSGEFTPPPANSPIPARIQRALERGLSQQPSERFASMEALLDALTLDRPRRSRPLWWSAGGASVAIGVYAAIGTPDQDPCTGGEARLARVWSPDHAENLRESFGRVDAAFSADTAEAVVRALDVYALEWSASYRDACEATHVRHEQSSHALDLRMSCLSQHLRALQSTVETLGKADESVVLAAPSAIGKLPSMGTCNDAEALDTWARPPSDPRVAAVVQDTRERIAALTARAHLLSARAGGEEEEVEALLKTAEETEHGPLIAELRFLAARYAVLGGQTNEGVEHLEETVYAALASDHDQVLAMALTQLTQATGIHLSRYEEGLRWARQAEAALARLGKDNVDAANYHAVMCKLLADKGDTSEALPHCHENVRLYESLYGEQSLQAAHAHEALGIAFFYAGAEEAQDEFELARDLFAAAQGETHPNLARVANSLAAVCFETRGASPCLHRFEDAVRRASTAYGDDHPSTSDFRNNLALVQLEAGEVENARASARQALTDRRARTGDDHPAVAASLRILGLVDQADGDIDAAREKLEQALEIAIATRGEDHRDVVDIREAIDGLDDE